jgi:hypothetical protein
MSSGPLVGRDVGIRPSLNNDLLLVKRRHHLNDSIALSLRHEALAWCCLRSGPALLLKRSIGEEKAMDSIRERERAFENRFAHDEELKFKALARRNKLIGMWAAKRLGRADADSYSRDVVLAGIAEVSDQDVFRKLRQDFDGSGVDVSDTDIRAKMVELLAEAVVQVENQ